MEVNTLNWCSLKPIKINNLRFTFSIGRDSSNKTVCIRIDLRLFVNGLPTTYGVNLTRWELIQLGAYIFEKQSLSTVENKSFYELSIESSNNGLSLTKRRGRLFIKNNELSVLTMYIPGLNYLACCFKPDELEKVDRSFEDIFIYSTLIKDEIKTIDEELIITGKLTA